MQCNSAAVTNTRGLCCQTLLSGSDAAAHLTAVPKRAAYSAPVHLPVLFMIQTKLFMNNWSALTCSKVNVARNVLVRTTCLAGSSAVEQNSQQQPQAPNPKPGLLLSAGSPVRSSTPGAHAHGGDPAPQPAYPCRPCPRKCEPCHTMQLCALRCCCTWCACISTSHSHLMSIKLFVMCTTAATHLHRTSLGCCLRRLLL